MHTYHLRFTAARLPSMTALGVALGALVIVPATTQEQEVVTEWTPDNFVQVLIPYTYDPLHSEEWNIAQQALYESQNPDYTTINTGRQPCAWSTVTVEVPERIEATGGGCWDYIGPIYVPNGETIETEMFGLQPVMVPLVNEQGEVLLHANLLTDEDLRANAEALAASHPEIAAGLADLSLYFVVDAEGNAKAPSNPHRVFAV